MRTSIRVGLGFFAAALTAGCGGGGGGGGADAGAPGGIDGAVGGAPDATAAGSIDAAAGGEDLDMQAGDFECVLDWDLVRAFRITNKLGHLEGALAVANNPAGGQYPVGTIIQIVPQEAMVKRRPGWNPPSGDWEFFNLSVSASGTTINDRGDDTVNAFGGACLTCHDKAMPQFDFVCETDHGCDPLPISTDQLLAIQNADPRCP